MIVVEDRVYDLSYYAVDFSNHKNLEQDDIDKLHQIQKDYRPMERAEHLSEFKLLGKITSDEYETMTGIPYEY